MKKLQKISAALVAGGLMLGLALCPVPASATDSFRIGANEDDATNDADRVASMIEAVAPGSELAPPGDTIGEHLVSSSGAVETQIPLAAGGDLLINAESEAGRQSASLSLPDEIAIGDGAVAEDGTVVFSAVDGSGEAVAVQSLADGSTRIQTVISSGESAHEFGYSIEGYMPYQADSGEAIFINGLGDFVTVAEPWAVDANGDAVETAYEIRGHKLVQVVTPDESTVYPVVADPTWRWLGPAWGMKLTRNETSRVRDLALAGSMCIAFTKGAPGVAVACGVFAGYMATQAALAESDRPKTCLFFTAAPIPGVIWRVPC